MNKIFSLLIIVIFGLTSCDKKQKNSESKNITDSRTEIGKINDLLKQYEEPSQIFKISTDEISQIKGKQGTIISINPDDLVTENGQPLGKSIEVELKELTNQDELLRANAQTTSNGQLLISGGAYYINLTSDGQQLKLKVGKTLSVEFPKLSNTKMSLFYGQRDSLGQMNWQQTEQKFESKIKRDTSLTSPITPNDKKDTSKLINDLTPDEKKQLEAKEKMYEAIQLSQLGWINCDIFYENPNKTDLLFTFNPKDSIICANIYLVFKDINSLMQEDYINFTDLEYNSGFKNIPIGSKTRLIAFSIKDGKTYTFQSDLIIKKSETVQMTLKETDQAQIAKILSN